MPQSSLQGVTSSIAQYNEKEGKIKGVNDYRKQVLNEIREYVKNQKGSISAV